MILHPLAGGCLIGVAVSILLLFNGRVTGISGIIDSSLAKPKRGDLWRWTLLAGMVAGGVIVNFINPDLFINQTDRSPATVALAGFLVGFGTVLGSGCTSGHGVCGISRLSIRSIIATLTFMTFGFLAVMAVRYLLGVTS